jgi:hypothetical protein
MDTASMDGNTLGAMVTLRMRLQVSARACCACSPHPGCPVASAQPAAVTRAQPLQSQTGSCAPTSPPTSPPPPPPQCDILRAGSREPCETHEVLNEVVIDRGSNSFLTNIECYESGRFVTRVQADGVMLATPTGARTRAAQQPGAAPSCGPPSSPTTITT